MKTFRYRGTVAAGMAAILMIGCGRGERNAASPETAGGTGRDAEAEQPPLQPPADGREGIVLFMGTSLTAGLGVAPDEAYPMLVDSMLEGAGLPLRAVNAGVSGETSAGALGRIDWLLEQPFDVLVLETGANDMLRGTDPGAVERNLQTILDRVREERPEATIVMAGMRATPNLGPAYVEEFEALYPRVAARNGVPLIPFLLEGVAGEPELNQPDGIHPNPEGHRRVAENVWAVLEPVLDDALERSGAPAD